MTPRIHIDLAGQTLALWRGGQRRAEYPVSTAANGAGERRGSFQTPRGLHRVRLRIGDGCPRNAVFVGRRFTGEIYTPQLAAEHPGRDWILTRILWLHGLEPGKNRYGEVDTLRRYVYIHGTPDTTPIGVPGSRGCVRMRNGDLVELFDQVRNGCLVEIIE